MNKSELKQLIKEEIDLVTSEGIFDRFRKSPPSTQPKTSKDYEEVIEKYEEYIEEQIFSLNPNATTNSHFDMIFSQIEDYIKALKAISEEITHSNLPNKEELKYNILRIIKKGNEFISDNSAY